MTHSNKCPLSGFDSSNKTTISLAKSYTCQLKKKKKKKTIQTQMRCKIPFETNMQKNKQKNPNILKFRRTDNSLLNELWCENLKKVRFSFNIKQPQKKITKQNLHYLFVHGDQ